MRFRFFKQRSVFLAGLGIGFVFPLLLSFLWSIFVSDLAREQDPPAWYPEYYLNRKSHCEQIILQHWRKERRLSDGVMYSTWLEKQNLRLSSLDLDRYLYGPQEDDDVQEIEENGRIEWRWLRKRVSITCVVFVEKLKLAKSIQATWGKRCNDIYFFGHRLKKMDADEVPIINVAAKIVSSWQLLCEAMKYIWEDRTANKIEWIIFVKDDTMVIPENLRYMVAPLDHNSDYYLGHPVVLWGQTYNLAQSGYVLSKGALAKVVRMFNTSEKCVTGGKYWKKEDYYLGKNDSVRIYVTVLAMLMLHAFCRETPFLPGHTSVRHQGPVLKRHFPRLFLTKSLVGRCQTGQLLYACRVSNERRMLLAGIRDF